MRILYTKQNKINDPDRELYYTRSEIPGLIYTFSPEAAGINSHGYWDHEYSLTKKNHTFRIIVIGDSVAKGHLLDELDEAFSKVLEKKLNTFLKPKNYDAEVITLARDGYSTSQELIILKNEAMLYSPDLIIWSYVLNDPANPVYHNANGDLGRYFYQPKIHIINFLSKKLFFIKEKIKARDCPDEFHKFLHCVYWDQVESHINQIGKISREKDVPILFLIHPIFEDKNTFKTYSLVALHKKLNATASNAGLVVPDLLEAYIPYNPRDLHIPDKTWFDPWHPNAKGHRIIAEFLYHQLEEKQFIKGWLTENAGK